MDLDAKIQANAQGFFVVTFFNKQEESLTEPTVKYIFSKFGQVSGIKYVEHGQVFISYKKKEDALKAFEIMNMGKKYHVEINSQPVEKNETSEGIKTKEEDSFIYLHIPPNSWDSMKSRVKSYVSCQLFGFREGWNPKDFVFSWLYTGNMKIVFDSKMAKDEMMEKHKKNPLRWPRAVGGNFEFCDAEDLPIAYIQSPNFSLPAFSVRNEMFPGGTEGRRKIRSIYQRKYEKLVVVVFDTKITKDEVIQAHNKKPFFWRGRENIEAFKFLSTSEALSMFDKKKED